MYKQRNAEVLRPGKARRPQDDKVGGRIENVTTATAGNLAGHPEKDKEKVEKRRALGRGLESLLPGPRVVRPAESSSAAGVAPASAVPGSRITTGAEAPGSGAPDAALKGRSSTAGMAVEPNLAAGATNAAELRSAGQPMAAVPTQAVPTHAVPTLAGAAAQPAGVTMSAAALSAVPAAPSSAIATGVVDYDPFGDAPKDGVIEIQAMADTRVPSNLVVNVAISDVDKNPFQTRYVEDDEALEELADSIKANGVVQPIVVRPAEEEGRYILILGERRLHASKKAGKTHVPALVRRVSEQQAAEMTIVENLQREDLSPMEQAESFRVLSNKFSMTQQQIAERVGLSRVSVANYMRLLKLPREVMQMLMEKRINFAKAKELLKLGDNDRIAEAAVYAVQKGMNIEQVEMLVLRMDGLLDPLPGMPGVKKEQKSGGARWVDPNVRSAQMDLERMLGVRVRIRDRKGKGKIVIEYSTVDDYERVVEMLRGKK
jgi:ParB family transcriptional regulator, chromosome partitioning protein